jgi:hypothetical protein
VIGIEAIEPAAGRFRLRIHKEADRRRGGTRQRDIVLLDPTEVLIQPCENFF